MREVPDPVETRFGFIWGPLEVQRMADLDDGTVVVALKTDSGRWLDVYVSPQGRSVRIHEARRGGWWKSPSIQPFPADVGSLLSGVASNSVDDRNVRTLAVKETP